MTFRSFVVSLLSVLLLAPSAAGQQLSDLIEDGRFDEAAALLTTSGQPQSAVEAGARQIWEAAYRLGYQRDDFAYALRGFQAAGGLPGLGSETHQMIEFWHGFGLYLQALPEAEPRTLRSATNTLPKFELALTLMSGAREYASENRINLQGILDKTEAWIALDREVISR